MSQALKLSRHIAAIRQFRLDVLFGFAVEPHDLSAIEDIELSKIIRTAVHFGYVADVRPFVVEGPWKADVEVRRKDR